MCPLPTRAPHRERDPRAALVGFRMLMRAWRSRCVGKRARGTSSLVCACVCGRGEKNVWSLCGTLVELPQVPTPLQCERIVSSPLCVSSTTPLHYLWLLDMSFRSDGPQHRNALDYSS